MASLIAVQIMDEGDLCQVVLTDEQKMLLMEVIASLFEDRTIKVVKYPDSFKLVAMSELLKGGE